MPDSAMWHFPIEHGAGAVDLQPDFTTLRVLNSGPFGWRKKNCADH
jgi:alpha-ribazole phosphatase